MPDYTQHIPELAIIQQIFYVLSVILYAYGFSKWMQFSGHFMIKQRFPVISKLIVLISFIGGTLTTIRRWVQFTNNDALYLPQPKHSIEYMLWMTVVSSGQSVAFFVYGLINERLLLIYLRWKRNKNISVSEQHSNKSYKTIRMYCHPMSIAIFMLAMIGSLYIILYCLFEEIDSSRHIIIINSSLWAIMLMVNIILIFVIICNKVNDGIGCLKETLIMLCYLLLIAIFPPLVYTHDSLIFPCYLILSSVSFLQGFFPLFIPLYYIYKLEGTLNISQQKQITKKRIICHIKNTEYPLNRIVLSSSGTPTPHTPDIKIDDINAYLGFFEFIKDYKCYKSFCKYLSYAWAIENIRFLERVSIIYQIIIKYQKINDIENKPIANGTYNPYDQIVEIQENFVMQPLKFEYLKQIYLEYDAIITENKTDPNQYGLKYLQKPFRSIYKNIYNEFIADLAPNQINISSPTKIHLSFILDEHMDKLKTFNDFLDLFNDAKEEIGGLLISMYDYKFKEFVKEGITKNIFEE